MVYRQSNGLKIKLKKKKKKTTQAQILSLSPSVSFSLIISSLQESGPPISNSENQVFLVFL